MMPMQRRGFLGAIVGLVSGSVLDPEQLLWRPSKVISIPKPSRSFQIGYDFSTPEGLSQGDIEDGYMVLVMSAIKDRISTLGLRNYKLVDLPMSRIGDSRLLNREEFGGKGAARYINMVKPGGGMIHRVEVLMVPKRI
jgi:hypothetical protein